MNTTISTETARKRASEKKSCRERNTPRRKTCSKSCPATRSSHQGSHLRTSHLPEKRTDNLEMTSFQSRALSRAFVYVRCLESKACPMRASEGRGHGCIRRWKVREGNIRNHAHARRRVGGGCWLTCDSPTIARCLEVRRLFVNPTCDDHKPHNRNTQSRTTASHQPTRRGRKRRRTLHTSRARRLRLDDDNTGQCTDTQALHLHQSPAKKYQHGHTGCTLSGRTWHQGATHPRSYGARRGLHNEIGST